MLKSSSRLIHALLVVSIIGASHCSSPTSPGTLLTITRLRADPTALMPISGYAQPATIVLRNAQDFASAWTLVYQIESQPPPMPSVDFTTQMVVGVAIGKRPNADTDVIITGASEANGAITFDATVTTAGSSCVVETIVTSPVDLAIVPATSGSVRANLTRTTHSC